MCYNHLEIETEREGRNGLVNTNLLKGKIVASGIGRKKLAQLLHMSESTLSDKINGKRSFTTVEANRLCLIVGIESDSEKVAIFLPLTSQNQDEK